MFDGLAPAASNLVIAEKRVTRGDGASFIVAVEAPIAGTDVTVTSMMIDS